jgi:transposase
MIAKRVHTLLVFRQNDVNGISKRELVQTIGMNVNSIQAWFDRYFIGGIELFTKHSKKGCKFIVITLDEEQALIELMFDPENGFVG